MKRRNSDNRSGTSYRQERGISFTGVAGSVLYVGLIGRLIQWIMKEGRIQQRRRRYEEEMKLKPDLSESRDAEAVRPQPIREVPRPSAKPIPPEHLRPNKMASSYDAALSQAQSDQAQRIDLASTAVKAQETPQFFASGGEHAPRDIEAIADRANAPDESKTINDDEMRNHDFPDSSQTSNSDSHRLVVEPDSLPAIEKRNARRKDQSASNAAVQQNVATMIEADHITPDLQQEQK